MAALSGVLIHCTSSFALFLIYTGERTRWSSRSQHSFRLRPTYLRTWLEGRGFWRDFPVRAEGLKNHWKT
jgi:hypothetical protein